MLLHPEARRLLDYFAGLGGPPPEKLTVAEARARMRASVPARAPEPVGQVEDRTVPGPGGPVPIRIYRPAAPGPHPVLVYFHGGGWVLGDLDTHDNICRSLCRQAECMVVAVDYRLAPEHKYPAAVEDAYAATLWVVEKAHDLGADPGRVAVGGDSAGGNLAAVTCLVARDRGGPPLAFQLLVYPVTDAACNTESYREFATGYGLSQERMRQFWSYYLASPEQGSEPYASPLRAERLDGLPPALVITAEYDVLRDEGEAYARRLQEAGVAVQLSRYPGMIHGFWGPNPFPLTQQQASLREAAEALRRCFAPGS